MAAFTLDPEAHHYLGIEMNQQVWRLLGQEERSEREARRMVHFALASLHHWQHSPRWQPVNAQRGHWLLSRVFAVNGDGEKALAHAQACLTLSESEGLVDFDAAYAVEAMARAHAVAGNQEEALRFHGEATRAMEKIADKKDREIFQEDLEGGPWAGLVLGDTRQAQ